MNVVNICACCACFLFGVLLGLTIKVGRSEEQETIEQQIEELTKGRK